MIKLIFSGFSIDIIFLILSYLFHIISLICLLLVMILLYVKKIFSKSYASYGLSDARVASLTKKEYGSAVHFL